MTTTVKVKRKARFLGAALAGVLMLASTGCKLLELPPASAPLVTTPVRPWDEIFGVTIKRSSGEAYAVGNAGLLWTSTDRGKTWQRHHLNEYRQGSLMRQDLDLFGIQFDPSGEEGWIVGEEGLILHSTDGGKSWQLVHSPAKQRLLAVAAVAPHTVCAVGDHGVVLWSGDGGKTWTYQTINNLTFYGVSFADEQQGWLVGEFETVMHSSDGGKTWEVQRGGKIADFTVPPFFAVVPASDQNVLVAGQSGRFATSTDGGKTWNDSKLPTERSIFAVAAPASKPGTLWLAGAQGTIFSGSPGSEWNLKDPTVQDLTGLALEKDYGLAVGLEGTIARTDNGSNWQLVGTK